MNTGGAATDAFGLHQPRGSPGQKDGAFSENEVSAITEGS